MTLSQIISIIEEQNEEVIIFAKKVNGKFAPSSEVALVEVNDGELGTLTTKEIADKYCPGFDYFLEVFLVKELIEDLRPTVGYKSLEQKIDRIIYYAEFDA